MERRDSVSDPEPAPEHAGDKTADPETKKLSYPPRVGSIILEASVVYHQLNKAQTN